MDEEEKKKIASKGGKASQASGHAHELTEAERSEGGQNSPTQFKPGDDRTEEAAKKGGQS